MINFKYLRFHLFNRLKDPFSAWSRKRRMRTYASLMQIKEGMSILDLGGLPSIWEHVAPPVHLTILNLPDVGMKTGKSRHYVDYVEGDACHVGQFEDRSFDSIFSNSVIEHVGSAKNRAAFAHEVRRLGKSYWVQTPSKWFPIEAHCGMPFWWFYPTFLRLHLIRRWRQKLPDWTDMVEGTSVLTKSELRDLFPEATIIIERTLGLPKSYIAYFRGQADCI